MTNFGPPITPPKVSLLSSIEVINLKSDDEFRSQAIVEFDACGSEGDTALVCADETELSEDPGACSVEFTPFEILQSVAYQTTGADNFPAIKKRAERKLIACQSKMISNELWTGSLNIGNNSIASDDAFDITSDVAEEPDDALAALEDAIGIYGCSNAFIHTTPFMLNKIDKDLIFRVIDPQTGNITYYTRSGNKLIVDFGYDGSGPDGSPPASNYEWMYATTPIVVKLGPITLTPDSINSAIKRDVNKITARASRLAQVEFDSNCVHLAAKVTRNGFVDHNSSS